MCISCYFKSVQITTEAFKMLKNQNDKVTVFSMEEAVISTVWEGQTSLFCVNCMSIILSKLHWRCVSGICSTGTNCELTTLCRYFTMFVVDMEQKPEKWHLEIFFSLQQCSCFSAIYVQEFLTNGAMTVFLCTPRSSIPWLLYFSEAQVATESKDCSDISTIQVESQTSTGYY